MARRRVPAIIAVVLLCLTSGIFGHRSSGQAAFSSRLTRFELTVRTMGMPGKPIRTTVIASDGSISFEEEIRGRRTREARSTLPADEVERVRQALEALWNMEGDYDPPFWNQVSDRNYLSLSLMLADGSDREIWLAGVNPRPTRDLITTINAVVPDPYQILFYR